MSLAGFHPLVQQWFRARFAAPTDAQARGWPAIAAGEDVLIAAPTGSGKTLAAFLACIDRLLRDGLAGRLGDAVDVVYVSPLKALSNDVHKNLERPLAEIRELAATEGIGLPPIRVALRTGDTPQSERAKLVRRPPHILVTTPESLYLLLTAERGRAALSRVRTVIVDEIHAAAGDKRGTHLALSLERLDAVVRSSGKAPPARVGLSATQKPIELVGELLVGNRRPAPHILDGGHARELDLAIEITDDELGAVASNEQCGRVYDRVAELVRAHTTTLVFVNTRRQVERVSHQLEERLGADQVVAHHGSLSKEIRLAAELELASGTVRCAVATASLELGIDVGDVDLVVQIGSPRSIATLLQRIGRSGHSLGATPKGRLFALTRDQLVEAAALVRAIRAGTLDALSVPPAPLDVLAQQIAAEVACGERGEDEMYELVTGALPYRDLPREQFDAVLEMLAEGVSTRRGRSAAHIHRDRVNGRLKARRGARLAAITCGGTIPDTFLYPVVTFPDETPVGTLDEDFAIESHAGDIFLLGNTSWRIQRIEGGRVLVEDAQGAPPNVPFWFGEAPARTAELSAEVARLRREVEERLEDGHALAGIARWLEAEASLPALGAEQLVEYLAAGRAALGVMPTQDTLVAERFTDDAGGMQLVLHAPLGGRINKAWGLALRKRFCRSFNLELQAAATDDGIVISLGPPHSFPLAEVFEFLNARTCRTVLEQAVLGAPIFGTRWRWNACRALAILRRRAGSKTPPHILRMRSDDLLSTIFPMQQACLENVVGDIELPDHPLVFETMRDCTGEFMDASGLEELLGRIESGAVRVHAVDTAEPSPLCHELLSANPYAFLDDVPLEERRTRAVSLPRRLRLELDPELAILSTEAIETAESQARPVVRDADELHDALLSLYLVPVEPSWQPFFDELAAAGRATELSWGPSRAWVAAERLPIASALLTGAAAAPELGALPFAVEVPTAEVAAVAIARGHMEQRGPRTPAELAVELGLDEAVVLAAFATLEAEGALLRGGFRARDADEWCDRRMLARIQRLTIGRLRAQIEPVSAATLNRFLFRWQRVAGGARLIGPDGLGRIVEQLQGFESAAGAWERDILPARLHDYDTSWLDGLCFAGQVAWARLSPRAARADAAAAANGNGRSAPTRAAPLALMLREDLDWLRAPAAESADAELSDAAAAVHGALASRGASFLADLVRATEREPTEVEEALWELVACGLATADGFASLRVLLERHRGESRSRFDLGRRSGAARSSRWRETVKKARRRDGGRHVHAVRSLATSAGRWSLLGAPTADALDIEAHARQLLGRYGVVFRDLLARESALPPWRDLLRCLRRLEARGEVRGGRFVTGFVGEQFALPEAVELLRSLRLPPPRAELQRIAATDPLNLVGVTSPGPRVPAVVGNAVLYKDGVPIASLEAGELVLRAPLEPGARVDRDLVYHPPPASLNTAQASLPFR